MTIAACHVSSEGVVLGADSTTTITQGSSSVCHFDHAQKLFEVGGPQASVGLVTWGLGSIGPKSHRSIANEIGLMHQSSPFDTLEAMAVDLGNKVWELFANEYAEYIRIYKKVLNLLDSRSEIAPADLEIAKSAWNLRGGYCLAGRVKGENECRAFTIEWSPSVDAAVIHPVQKESPIFWGVPQFIERLIYGSDSNLVAALRESGKWKGTEDELLDIVTNAQLINPKQLPIREAIDWIHTVIHTTIRAIKFAQQPHSCGGPIEIAVVTSDRPFRWVQHKGLDSAIGRESR